MKEKIISFSKKTHTKAKEHKIITTIIIIVVGYLIYHYGINRTVTTTTYQYVNVKRGTIEATVSGTGQVVANSQVDLKPKVNANVTAVYVRTGDTVKQGQVLFRLDATDAYKSVRDAKISLESAHIALEKLTHPTDLSVMNIKNSIQAQKDAEESQNQKVDTAYKTLLTSGLQIVPNVSYTSETAPTLSGSYLKTDQGQINISVSKGGLSGYEFSASGVVSCVGDVNTVVAQPICDSGLYIKWNNTTPQNGWIINIPNTESTSYSSNYDAWQNAIQNRDIANAASERTIASLNQQLADLTPGDDNVDVRSAKLTVEQKQNALNDAQQNLSYYTITAPFDGTMANVAVDVGSSAVMASANGSSALGTIVTSKQLAQVTLNETDISKVSIGQKVNISVDAIDGLVLSGKVAEIDTLGTITSGVVTYKIKVAFDAHDPHVLPNMSVSADIVTDSKDDVLYVPNQAVKHDADGYYVEENPDMVNNASSTNRFANGTSTNRFNFASSTTASSTRIRNASSTFSGRRNQTVGTQATTTQTDIVLKRVPVEIGMQSDTQTEIVRGLHIGEEIVYKKTTTTGTASQATTAPSVTSLLRPSRNSGGGNFRGQ